MLGHNLKQDVQNFKFVCSLQHLCICWAITYNLSSKKASTGTACGALFIHLYANGIRFVSYSSSACQPVSMFVCPTIDTSVHSIYKSTLTQADHFPFICLSLQWSVHVHVLCQSASAGETCAHFDTHNLQCKVSS